jgi:hypothetical protein
MITLDNYEEYMMMHADGELQPHEEVALQAFINNNPTLKAEMALYQSARLTPDHSLVYTQKDALMKPMAEKKIIAMPRFRTYAIAAGVAALIVFTVGALYLSNSTDHNVSPVAASLPSNSTLPAVSNVPQQQLAVTAPSAQHTAVHTPQEVTKRPTASHTTVLPEKKNNSTGMANVKQVRINNIDGLAAKRKQQIINSMPVNSINELPVNRTQPAALALATVPGYEMPKIENEERPSWIDKLPLEEHKKKNLATMALAVANKCEQISEFKENITKKHVSLKVEHKNLIVSF